MSIYDKLREYLELQFDEGPAGSYISKNRLIQGSLDPAAGILRDPAQERDWLIEQSLNRLKTLPAEGQCTPDMLRGQALDYLDQLAQSYRYLERDWDVHYSQAMQTRMGTSRRLIGEGVSPMAYSQYDVLRGYGIRDKDQALEAIDIRRIYGAMPGYVETSPGVFAAASKVKRTQLQAQFHVHLDERSRMTSPIRMAGAPAPERGYNIYSATVWSGGLAPGQGYMQPGACSPYGVKTGSFYVNPEHLDDLELAGTGNLYRRGDQIPIASVGGHEQVGLTGVPTRRGYIKPGPASVGPDEFSQLRSAFIIGGEPGPSDQGCIDPSVGNVTSRRVMYVYAKPGESLTGLPERGTQWLPGQEVRLANELTGFTDRSWGYIKQG